MAEQAHALSARTEPPLLSTATHRCYPLLLTHRYPLNYQPF